MPSKPLEPQAFTIRFPGPASRIITKLGVSEACEPKDIFQQRIVETKSLWDTGATGSVISSKLAKALNLHPTGKAQINHAGGQATSLTYTVNLHLPNKVGIHGVHVSEMAEQADFDAIIGMDVIRFGDFAITNVNRKTVVSFRMPSVATIDYVDESNRSTFVGVGRNAPCPCGSGKKFKKCHHQRVRSN